MDKIPIPEYELAPLDHVAEGVTGARILFVNVYAVSIEGGGWTLIDAGLPFSADRIRKWAATHFGEQKAPAAIVLTHGHFDHVGAVKDLADAWNVPVFAHRLELPYLTGKSKYPPPDPSVGGGLMALMAPLYPRGPIDLGARVQELPNDGSVPGLPGWRMIETPGHTAGHVSFFRESDKTLIVGDAFCTTKQESFLAVATQRPELHGPPAYYTPDWEQAKRSVERLAELEPLALAIGHGPAMAGAEVPTALRELATNFDRIARPEHGRYVGEPIPKT
jgi:glyoxylase-like metal-dependent hydrolase (beta-lactamase superfamily II)